MVPRKAGWDTHGLPVELEVEKLLGINGKEQIEAYGIAPFIEKCKESVWKYKGHVGGFLRATWASGPTWSTPTSPMTTTIIEIRVVGPQADLGQGPALQGL